MRGRIALQKHFRAKSVEASVLFREAFGVRTRPRIALACFLPRGESYIRCHVTKTEIDHRLRRRAVRRLAEPIPSEYNSGSRRERV